VISLLLGVTFLMCGCKPTTKVAVYGNIKFCANDHRHFAELSFEVDGDHPRMPLYMRFGESDPVLLSELTEAKFEELLESNEETWDKDRLERQSSRSRVRNIYSTRSGISSFLAFDNGIFCIGSFHRMDELFSFSRNPDGPFYELGFTKSELIKAFGRPKKWETRTRIGV